MDRRMIPWSVAAGVIMVAFVVWLFSSMAGTEDSNRVLVTLAVCALVIALGIAIGIWFGQRDEKKEQRRRI